MEGLIQSSASVEKEEVEQCYKFPVSLTRVLEILH
jgi:hypothetical protein